MAFRDYTRGVGSGDTHYAGLGAISSAPASSVPKKSYAVNDNAIMGIAFPFKINSGKISISFDNDHIIESILQIIATNHFEYLMKPEFGSNLNERVFDPINLTLLVERDIRDAVENWEPRAIVKEIRAGFSQISNGRVDIYLSVEIKSTGDIIDLQTNIRG